MKALKETCSNRKKKLEKAYKEKEGRIITTLGTVKTAAAVIGYGLYAGMPTGLREYDVYDGIQDPFDSDTVANSADLTEVDTTG